MSMLFLILAVTLLALLTLAGILQTQRRLRAMEKRLASMDSDLRQFYRDLGRPRAEVINIKGGRRPS